MIFDTEKKGKDTNKVKVQLEAEVRNYEAQNLKEMEENYNFKMSLDKGSAFGAMHQGRHERDLKLIEDLRT